MDAASPNACRFCNIGRGLARESYDIPLAETADYFAVASVGALIPGWVLLCTRKHATNMSREYGRAQSTSLRLKVADMLRSRYESPIRLFEHGAGHVGSGTGCGVDHAHLHLVPLELPLIDGLRHVDSTLTWMPCRASELRSTSARHEYLFFSEDASEADPAGHVTILHKPTSQFFRKVIAHQLGRANEFNYRTNPNLQNTHATAAALKMLELAQ